MQRLQISFGPDYCDNFISSCTKRLHILKIFMVVETRHIEFQPTVLFSRIFLLIECLKKPYRYFTVKGMYGSSSYSRLKRNTECSIYNKVPLL